MGVWVRIGLWLAGVIVVVAGPVQPATAQANPEPDHVMPLVWKMDRKPWNPPAASLPDRYVKNGQALLSAGFGDPRGGEYREVYSGWEVLDPPANYRDGTPIPYAPKAEHGWYFPPENGMPARAVLPDGTTCIPTKVGPKEDLDADIRDALALSDPLSWTKAFDPREFKEPQGILVLSILGRYSDAQKLAEAANLGHVQDLDLANLDVKNYFLGSVRTYATDGFSQGHGDLAYEANSLLAILEPTLAPKLKSNAFFEPNTEEVLGDLRRRLSNPSPPFRIGDVKGLPQSERIAKLIDGLDQVSILLADMGSMQRYERFIDTDVVHALIEEGAPAVDPLLACIEHDGRLTRSRRYQIFCSVKEPAFDAVCAIIGFGRLVTPFDPFNAFEITPGWSPVQCLPALKQKWAKLGSLTPEERYFRILADDNGSLDTWFEAAVRLMCPEDTGILGVTDFGHPWDPFSKVVTRASVKIGFDEPINPRLSKFRGSRSPSFSGLLAKRIHRLLDTPSSAPWVLATNVVRALRLARYLADWDPKAGLPVVRAAEGRIRPLLQNQAAMQNLQGPEPTWSYQLRASLGDSKAMPDYISLLESFPEGSIGMFTEWQTWLGPIIAQRDKPFYSALLQRLFNDKGSAWNPSNQDLDAADSRLLSPLFGFFLILCGLGSNLFLRMVDGLRPVPGLPRPV